MAVYKRSSVVYGGGVDIGNTIVPPVRREEPKRAAEPAAEAPKAAPKHEPTIDEIRTELAYQAMELEHQRQELARIRDGYIEQGKQVIIDAKKRADGIIQNAHDSAAQIVAQAEQSRTDIQIKAKAEGFEQGKKDGVEAVLAAGRDVLGEVKTLCEQIVAEKGELFDRYEKDIFDTVMTIANKVTLNSMSVKDTTAAKKLIKQAAKDFRSAQRIKITLNKSEATEELAGDYEYLKELCGGSAAIEIELLENAEEGTVIVEADGEITDAGIMTQLRMIQELGRGKFRGSGTKKTSRKKKSDEESEPEE